MKVSSSAPGKLVLLGEYAVLEGAPALVMATDRRAEVSIVPESDDTCTVETPGHSLITASFQLARDGLHWRSNVSAFVRKHFNLVSEIIRYLVAREILSLGNGTAFKATLDTLDFFHPRSNGRSDKLGLGSSAALTVALASALAEFSGNTEEKLDRESWLVTLLNAHRQFQQGRGSGLDVATSLYGGVIEYQLDEGRNKPKVRPLALPEGLHFLCVWSGLSASTDEYLKKIRAWQKRDPTGLKHSIIELGAVSSAGIRAASGGDTPEFLNAMFNYGRMLKKLGDSSGVDIFSAEHQAIAQMAEKAGIVYKPSGAGGGDIGVACTADPEQLVAFRKLVEEAGFHTFGLQVDPCGLLTESTLEA